MGATAAKASIYLKRDVRLRLKAVPEAASVGRAFVEEALDGWTLRRLIPDGKLIVSELISNSVVAAPGEDVWLLLTRERNAVWICVWDSSPALPEARPYELDAESGRGMHIVAAIADGNGAFRVPGSQGKVTWARLTI